MDNKNKNKIKLFGKSGKFSKIECDFWTNAQTTSYFNVNL